MKREAVVLECAERRARLHRIDDDAAVHEFEPGDVGRPREGGVHRVGVAVMIIERDIAGHVVIELRRAVLRAGFRPRSRPAAARYRP